MHRFTSQRAFRYIAAELLELGSRNSDSRRRSSVTSRDIVLAIQQDVELQQCFGAVDIAAGGRVNAHNIILDLEFQLKQ